MIRSLLRFLLLRAQAAQLQWLERKRLRARAIDNVDWLIHELQSRNVQAEAKLLDDLTASRTIFLRMLNNEQAACRVIETFRWESTKADAHGILDDLFVSYNRSAMFSLLAQISEDYGIPKKLQRGFESATSYSLLKFLNLADNQVDPLCKYLRGVRDAVNKLALGGGRIFLMEMPTGNSLIVECMAHLLGPGKAKIVNVSLSRNDSRKRGITRLELLSEKMAEEAVAANDLILYIDEWATGVNFHIICDLLRRVIPANAYLLPIAIMAPSAAEYPRFDSFQADHDNITRRWGSLLANYRLMLPPLIAVGRPHGEFFWSEKDRLAGYRKLQIHGAIFSSLDAAIELLNTDSNALDATLTVMVNVMTKDHALPAPFAETTTILRDYFREGYSDYQLCREELRLSADKHARGDKVTELESGLHEIISGYAPIIDHRPARNAVATAGYFLNHLGSLDPENRYLLPNHVPTLEILSGTAAIPHRVALNHLLTRLDDCP